MSVGSESKINRIIQDPDSRDVKMKDVLRKGKLHLGSLSNDFFGVHDLLLAKAHRQVIKI
jgi:hypothetical protein